MTYECEGIGKNAVCGKPATVQAHSAYRWSSEKQINERVPIWHCPEHAKALKDIISEWYL
jgi:hypothetical protein